LTQPQGKLVWVTRGAVFDVAVTFAEVRRILVAGMAVCWTMSITGSFIFRRASPTVLRGVGRSGFFL